MAITFQPDLPLQAGEADELGFSEFVESLAGAIRGTRPPFVFGVLGDWGAGKTSILQLLADRLQGQLDDPNGGPPRCVPIWFNAWKYENEANLIYPLLYAIRQDYLRRGGQSPAFLEKFRQAAVAGSLLLTDALLRLASHQLTGEAITLKDGKDLLEAAQGHAGLAEQVLCNWADQVDQFERAFQDLLRRYAEDLAGASGGPQGMSRPQAGPTRQPSDFRFVILVDDLDRCLPETVIKILESIKNYLGADNVVFVLALNPRVVYQGIRSKYANLEIDGRQYLEKILNYSFYVPEPEAECLVNFTHTLLGKLAGENPDRFSGYFKDFAEAVQKCSFSNPRKVKRILNHFLFFLDLHADEINHYDLRRLPRLIILAEYFPELFQLFLQETAEQAAKQLREIGNQNFNRERFQQDFPVNLTGIYDQLCQMRGLFDLGQKSGSHYDLRRHAQAVYQIVHHPA